VQNGGETEDVGMEGLVISFADGRMMKRREMGMHSSKMFPVSLGKGKVWKSQRGVLDTCTTLQT
jgi:hypothetical protein